MRKILIVLALLVFIVSSCKVNKDNNIYVDHAKEKRTYNKASDKKYDSADAKKKKRKKIIK